MAGVKPSAWGRATPMAGIVGRSTGFGGLRRPPRVGPAELDSASLRRAADPYIANPVTRSGAEPSTPTSPFRSAQRSRAVDPYIARSVGKDTRIARTSLLRQLDILLNEDRYLPF